MARPVNVLLMIDSLHHGGTEKQLVSLVEKIDRERFSPSLVTLRKSSALFEELQVPKLMIGFTSFFKVNFPITVLRLVDYIRSNDIKIVHTFFQDSFLLAAAARLFCRFKLVGSFRDMGFWRSRSESLKMRLAYPAFDGFLANSKAVRDEFVKTDKLESARFEVIYNGCEVPEEKQLPGQDGPVVGIVANLNRPVKRVDDFIKASAKVFTAYPDTRFVIVGDGNLRPELEELAGKSGILDVTTFVGRVENPTELIRTFSVGLITSETEGFSNAILEYMALGVPVVATDTGGNPEIVVDGVSGYLAPVGDVDGLAGGIIALLSDPDAAKSIGERNRATIKERFTFEAMCRAHENFYLSLLEGD